MGAVKVEKVTGRLMQESSWEHGSITGSKAGVRKTTWWVRIDYRECVKVGFWNYAWRKLERK